MGKRALFLIVISIAMVGCIFVVGEGNNPSISFNLSTPGYIVSNITLLLTANFSDIDDGFFGNVTLVSFSDSSLKKTIVFEQASNKTVYLRLPKRARVINFTLNLEGKPQIKTTFSNLGFERGNFDGWTVVERPDNCAKDTRCPDDWVCNPSNFSCAPGDYYCQVTNEWGVNVGCDSAYTTNIISDASEILDGLYCAELSIAGYGLHSDASIDLRKDLGVINNPYNISFYTRFNYTLWENNILYGNDFSVRILNGSDEILEDKRVYPGEEIVIWQLPRKLGVPDAETISAYPTEWTFKSYDLSPYIGQNITIIFRIKQVFYLWDVWMMSVPRWDLDNFTVESSLINDSEYPNSPAINIGNNTNIDWLYNDTLNTTITIPNLASSIEEYLSNCEPDSDGNCLVPIVFSSNSTGKITVNNITLDYENNKTCQFCIASDGICDTEWTLWNSTQINMSYVGDNHLEGTCSYYWNTSLFGDAVYNTSYKIDDLSNNVISTSKQITLDRAAPIIYLSYPYDSGAIQINFTPNMSYTVYFYFFVSDVSPLSNCSLIFNGQRNKTDQGVVVGWIYTVSLALPIMSVGYNWSIDCTDIYNFQGSSETRRFSIIYLGDNFTGKTTDFGAVNTSNISNLILENVNYGMINFSGSIIDLSGIYDINNYVKIKNYSIEINSSAYPNFNISALIYFYNVTFQNHRILRNGVLCPTDICQLIGQYDDILVYNVSSFSSYTIEEIPSSGISDVSSGGSGSCTPKWNCTEWSACSAKGIQTRECVNLKPYCPGVKPEIEKECSLGEKETGEGTKQIPKEQERPIEGEISKESYKKQPLFGILITVGISIFVVISIISIILLKKQKPRKSP